MNDKSELREKVSAMEAELAAMKAILDKPEGISKEQRFLELSNNLVRRYDFNKNTDIKYYNSDNEWLFQQDLKNGYLWCSYDRIWSVFEKEYGMDYQQIQDFIKGMVEKHFNWEGLTPSRIGWYHRIEVEKHFNWEGLTPGH